MPPTWAKSLLRDAWTRADYFVKQVDNLPDISSAEHHENRDRLFVVYPRTISEVIYCDAWRPTDDLCEAPDFAHFVLHFKSKPSYFAFAMVYRSLPTSSGTGQVYYFTDFDQLKAHIHSITRSDVADEITSIVYEIPTPDDETTDD